MSNTYAAKYTVKDANTGKTKSFTVNGIDPEVYNQVENESRQDMTKVAEFGIAYAAAYGSDTSLAKATVVKTSTQTVFDVTR